MGPASCPPSGLLRLGVPLPDRDPSNNITMRGRLSNFAEGARLESGGRRDSSAKRLVSDVGQDGILRPSGTRPSAASMGPDRGTGPRRKEAGCQPAAGCGSASHSFYYGTMRLIVAVLAVSSLWAQQYDLVLANGHVMDPASGVDA